MESLQGKLLIAAPSLDDPNFARAVVLIIQHDEDGAFGVVLNRPTDKSIREIWEEIGGGECLSEAKLHLGGPVSGPLLALHTNFALSEQEVLPGVYLSTRKDHLDQLVNEETMDLRLYAGYSGWGGGQLESEMEVGGWMTLPANSDYVFTAEDDLWDQAGKEITGDFIKRLGIRHVPDDPSFN